MTDMKPFGELSDAYAGALLLAQFKGKRIEQHFGPFGWQPKDPGAFQEGSLYRIAPEPLIPDSINWEHVASEYNFMARGPSGFTALVATEPFIKPDRWFIASDKIPAAAFASYRRGTVDWRDSLVVRPS